MTGFRTTRMAARAALERQSQPPPSCSVCRGSGGWQQPDGAIEECPRGCMTADGFDAAVSAGPIVDNAGHLTVIGQLEYDGPRCAGGCGDAVEDDDGRCEDCAGHCTECGRDVARPGMCFDCDVEASYASGLAPRVRAQP